MVVAEVGVAFEVLVEVELVVAVEVVAAVGVVVAGVAVVGVAAVGVDNWVMDSEQSQGFAEAELSVGPANDLQ